MESSNKKGLAVTIIALSVVGLAYYYLIYKKNGISGSDAYSLFDNFKSLQTNLGIKSGKDNIVIAKFNDGKNIAQFYDNNRIIIFNNDKKIVVKGSYSNGGQTINLDNGKVIEGNSIWNNLLQTIK